MTKTKQPHPCTRRTLAAGETATVELCSCGATHLTIGALTLRLTTCAFAQLAATLDAAARTLALDTAPGTGARERVVA